MSSQAASTHSSTAVAKLAAGRLFDWKMKHTIIAVACGVALIAAIVALVWIRQVRNAAPAMNAAIEDMARFVGSPKYNELPFGKQQQYMVKLDERKTELATAFKAGQLSQEEARNAMNYSWFGKRLHEMDLYYATPEGELREQYLESLAKEIRAKQKRAKAAAATQPAAEEDDVNDAGLPKHSQVAEAEIPKTWPAEMQQKWQIYNQTLDDKVDSLKNKKKKKGKS